MGSRRRVRLLAIPKGGCVCDRVKNYKQIAQASFPAYTGANCNMMPIIHGDADSVPEVFRGYMPILELCDFRPSSTVYLSVRESVVPVGATQSRPGVHTERFSGLGWGGWGGRKGLYMASTDGSCVVWDESVDNVDRHGSVAEPISAGHQMLPNVLYWMHDRTPHAAIPVTSTTRRQWVRLVSEEIGGWWEQHSTPNPLGVTPKCRILKGNKFDG